MLIPEEIYTKTTLLFSNEQRLLYISEVFHPNDISNEGKKLSYDIKDND